VCGSLRRENQDKYVGRPEWKGKGSWWRIGTAEGETQARWDSHAKLENIEQWKKGEWKLCEVYTSGYTEGPDKREYDVPVGRALAALYKIVVEGGKYVKVFQLLTRPARYAEKQVWHRFPVTVKPGWYRRQRAR
jgi:hypothetical protein